MIKSYIPHSENLNTFQIQNTSLNCLITVAKTCEKVLRLNMSESKRKIIQNLKKHHITKQLLTLISVEMKIYLPLKVIFTSALRSR